MLRVLENVRNGTVNPQQIVRAENTQRACSFDLSKHRDVESSHNGSINTLDIESIEGRYLLSGASDGTVAIHDLDNVSGIPQYTCKTISKIHRQSRYCHAHSVETVQWYPFDTGMFTSSGMDKVVKLWDTNSMKPVEVFNISGRVFQHHMSSIATKHCLVAVARSSSSVVLIDLKSGASVQELRGHSAEVLTVRWSPRDEFLLASGATDGKLLLWDIRRAKAILQTFDRHNGEIHGGSKGKGKAYVGPGGAIAHDGRVNGLCFTQDGLQMLSFGTDERLRLWNMWTGRNENVNFGRIDNDSRRSVKIDISHGCRPDVVYVPSEGNVLAFEIQVGFKLNTMLGHFDTVFCCRYHPHYQELYSGGSDRNILVWTSDHQQTLAYEEFLRSQTSKEVTGWAKINKRNVTADAWSSDED